MDPTEQELLDSDSSDEDYMPSDGEKGSEEDQSGDEEDIESLIKDTEGQQPSPGKKRKRKTKKPEDLKARKRRGGIRLEGETESVEEPSAEEPENSAAGYLAETTEEEKRKKEEKEKAKSDELWADFMKKVDTPKQQLKPTSLTTVTASTTSQSEAVSKTPSTKVQITKEFDFAGETVKITKEVEASSVEAKQVQSLSCIPASPAERTPAERTPAERTSAERTPAERPTAQTASSSLSLPGVKLNAPSGGGLAGVLNKIGKKPKLSVLDKSKLDWDTFKEKQGISEELQTFNKGKQGYIERMAFLQRTDQRQFEIERDMRQNTRKKPF